MVLAIASLLLASPAVCLDLRGNAVTPLQGSAKATVLIFYIAHCPIAQKMTPEINRLHREFARKGVRIFLIHEDAALSPREVADEAKVFGLLPTVLLDQKHAQMKQSKATISPEAFVYDSQMKPQYSGRINDLFFGLGQMRPKATTRDLRDAVQAVLDGKAPRIVKTEAIGCILPR